MRNCIRITTALAFVTSPFFSLVSHAVDHEDANLEISAFVAVNCTISTDLIEFGDYDPVNVNVASPLLGTGAVNVRCTQGADVVIELDEGAHPKVASLPAAPQRQLAYGVGFLSYSLYSDNAGAVWGTGPTVDVAHTGTGSTTSLTVYGSVAAAQNVPSGEYADVVVASVTF